MSIKYTAADINSLMDAWQSQEATALKAFEIFGEYSPEYHEARTKASEAQRTYKAAYAIYDKEVVAPYYNPGSSLPLNRQYNLNTKYGRKKAHQQALYNYENGTPEYRKEIDGISSVVWFVIILFCAIIFILIWNISGPEAALNWLK